MFSFSRPTLWEGEGFTLGPTGLPLQIRKNANFNRNAGRRLPCRSMRGWMLMAWFTFVHLLAFYAAWRLTINNTLPLYQLCDQEDARTTQDIPESTLSQPAHEIAQVDHDFDIQYAQDLQRDMERHPEPASDNDVNVGASFTSASDLRSDGIARGAALGLVAKRENCITDKYLACRIHKESLRWHLYAQFRCNTTAPKQLPKMNPAYKSLVDTTFDEDCSERNTIRKIPFGVTSTNTPLFARLRMTGYVPDRVYVNSPKLYRSLPAEDALQGKYYGVCSVVGSSGILIDSGCGISIDNSDFVFRFNLAKIRGFEKDVGSKTSFMTFNPSLILLHNRTTEMKGKYRENHEARMEFLSRLIEEFGTEALWSIMAFTWSPEDVQTGIPTYRLMDSLRALNRSLYHIHPSFIMAMNRAANPYLETGKRITTGTLILLLSTMICGEVNVYGFYPFERAWDGSAVKYHYYDHIEGLSNPKHNFNHDLAVALRMQEEGLIRLHNGKC